MARDLIPPPSPAGRALPEGTPPPDGHPWLVASPPEHVVEAAAAPPPPPPPRNLAPTRFRNRFGFLMGALGGVLIAAGIVVAVILTSSGGPSDYGLAKNWSAWKPGDHSIDNGAPEIAAHVESEYRLDNGDQIAAVDGGGLQVQGFQLSVLLRPSDGIVRRLGNKGVLYTLNGLGPNGSILGGTPSESRHQLLRREALELALYTFRYIHGVNMVVTILPPAPPAADDDSATAAATATATPAGSAAADPATPPLQAVFYRPGDLKSRLEIPLGATVPANTPRPDTIGSSEGKIIDSLTLSNLFTASFQQAQDLTPYLVLDRTTG
jgi:hypothetical protein